MATNDLRRPTDEEQALLAIVYTSVRALESKRFKPVAVAMARDVIEDDNKGRWSVMYGLPVIEAPDSMFTDPDKPRVVICVQTGDYL